VRPAWFLNDASNRLVGVFWKEGDVMVLADLKGNRFRVQPKTTIKQAVRILLSRQEMIA
jgi:hypothetical protein